MEINLTVESNSEAGLVDIQQIRSDRFQFSICLSRATVLVKKLANKYYNEILPGDSKKITRSHHVLRFLMFCELSSRKAGGLRKPPGRGRRQLP